MGVQLVWKTPAIPKDQSGRAKPLQCHMYALVSSEKNHVDSTLGRGPFKAAGRTSGRAREPSWYCFCVDRAEANCGVVAWVAVATPIAHAWL